MPFIKVALLRPSQNMNLRIEAGVIEGGGNDGNTRIFPINCNRMTTTATYCTNHPHNIDEMISASSENKFTVINASTTTRVVRIQ